MAFIAAKASRSSCSWPAVRRLTLRRQWSAAAGTVAVGVPVPLKGRAREMVRAVLFAATEARRRRRGRPYAQRFPSATIRRVSGRGPTNSPHHDLPNGSHPLRWQVPYRGAAHLGCADNAAGIAVIGPATFVVHSTPRSSPATLAVPRQQ